MMINTKFIDKHYIQMVGLMTIMMMNMMMMMIMMMMMVMIQRLFVIIIIILKSFDCLMIKDTGNVIDGILDDNDNHVLYSGYYMKNSSYVFMIIIVKLIKHDHVQ